MTDELAFHWRAKFTDGTVLCQFDENGKAHSFAEVQEKQDALVQFWLELVDAPEAFNVGVSLVDGSINIGELTIHTMKDDIDWREIKPEFRVINFRRVREHMTQNFGVIGREIDYYVGWQTTLDGKNYKKLVKIGADGTLSVS